MCPYNKHYNTKEKQTAHIFSYYFALITLIYLSTFIERSDKELKFIIVSNINESIEHCDKQVQNLLKIRR